MDLDAISLASFYKRIRAMAPVSEECAFRIAGACQAKTFRKGGLVLKEKEICSDIYFVNSGLLRIFYHKEEKEISEWFAFEQSFCFSIHSFFMHVPSHLVIQCIEDSEVFFIPRAWLEDMRMRDFEVADFYFNLLKGSLIASQERMMAFQFETATSRYEKLIQLHRDFLLRVPLQYIASYLGVSAETLSRIRGRG